MGLTETHIKESIIEQAGEYKKKSTVYHNGVEGTNRYTGVKILIKITRDCMVVWHEFRPKGSHKKHETRLVEDNKEICWKECDNKHWENQ